MLCWNLLWGTQPRARAACIITCVFGVWFCVPLLIEHQLGLHSHAGSSGFSLPWRLIYLSGAKWGTKYSSPVNDKHLYRNGLMGYICWIWSECGGIYFFVTSTVNTISLWLIGICVYSMWSLCHWEWSATMSWPPRNIHIIYHHSLVGWYNRSGSETMPLPILLQYIEIAQHAALNVSQMTPQVVNMENAQKYYWDSSRRIRIYFSY